MVSAKLLVPSGTPDQESCGDMFSPTQLALPAVLFATFLGIICPSLKVVEVRVKGSAADATPFQARATASAPTADRLFQTNVRDMAVLPVATPGPERRPVAWFARPGSPGRVRLRVFHPARRRGKGQVGGGGAHGAGRQGSPLV